MKLYLWDTNTASDLVKDIPGMRERYKTISPSQVAISAVTEAELRYGLAKKPEAIRIANRVAELLKSITILPWTGRLAPYYARLRTEAAKAGIAIGALDLLIATHAYARDRVLVTSDVALRRLEPWIRIENWRA